MIDRVFSLWQAVHNNSYVEPMAAVGGTFTYSQGTIRDVNSRKSHTTGKSPTGL